MLFKNGFLVLRGATGGASLHALLSALAGFARARKTTNSSCVSGDSLGCVEGPGTCGREAIDCTRPGGLKLKISANLFSSRLCEDSSGSRSKH